MPDIIPPQRPQRSLVGLILAKVESTFNTDPLPVVGSDSFLVENIRYRVTPQVLRRNPQRRSLGSYRYKTGRKTAEVTFSHELKGSGASGVDPKFATLLRGCGFALTTVTNVTASVLQTPFALPVNGLSAGGQTATFAKTTNVTNGGYGRYKITCVLGGASATAKLRVSGNPQDLDNTILSSEEFRATVMGDVPTTTLTYGGTVLAPTYTVAGTPRGGDILVAVIGGVTFVYTLTNSDTATTAANALAALIAADARFTGTTNTLGVVNVTLNGLALGVVVTSGTTAVTMGASGAQYTPTWTGNLVAGDQWRADLLRPGEHATPVTSGQESLTLYVYKDGNFHKITGAMGSCRISGRAGEYLMGEFTFQGQYVDASEATFPTNGVVFEQTDPSEWEQAQFTLGDYSDLPVDTITINLANTLTVRPDASKKDGYNGFIITQRDFTVDIVHEAIGEAFWAQWRHFTQADIMRFALRLGNGTALNSVYVSSNSAQITSNNYQPQTNLDYYNDSLGLSTETDAGDDEIRLVFA